MDTGFRRYGHRNKILNVNQYYVYILANRPNGTLYVGFTSDLIGRIYQHKNDMVDGFTKRNQVHSLVYFETGGNYESTLQREKQIKEWKRQWKIELIEKNNPDWKDLYEELYR